MDARKKPDFPLHKMNPASRICSQVSICHWLVIRYIYVHGRTFNDSPIAQWSERCTYEVTMNARVPSSILGGTTIFPSSPQPLGAEFSKPFLILNLGQVCGMLMHRILTVLVTCSGINRAIVTPSQNRRAKWFPPWPHALSISVVFYNIKLNFGVNGVHPDVGQSQTISASSRNMQPLSIRLSGPYILPHRP